MIVIDYNKVEDEDRQANVEIIKYVMDILLK
jgi:hypothetical protein